MVVSHRIDQDNDALASAQVYSRSTPGFKGSKIGQWQNPGNEAVAF